MINTVANFTFFSKRALKKNMKESCYLHCHYNFWKENKPTLLLLYDKTTKNGNHRKKGDLSIYKVCSVKQFLNCFHFPYFPDDLGILPQGQILGPGQCPKRFGSHLCNSEPTFCRWTGQGLESGNAQARMPSPHWSGTFLPPIQGSSLGLGNRPRGAPSPLPPQHQPKNQPQKTPGKQTKAFSDSLPPLPLQGAILAPYRAGGLLTPQTPKSSGSYSCFLSIYVTWSFQVLPF